MKLITKDIRDGKHRGEIVWVTHFNQPDLDKKALRNVPPTKCIVKSIDETKKRVYYSENYFAPLSKKGEATAKVISPVDNTGFRSHCGNELFVFTTEEEAIELWNSQVTAAVNTLTKRAEGARQALLDQANELSTKLK